MTPFHKKTFVKLHKDNKPLVVSIVNEYVGVFVVKDLDNGFIEEIDPTYEMIRPTGIHYDRTEMKTRRRFIPTDKGMEMIDFELL